MTPNPSEARALERSIYELHRLTETGFATVRGDINVLATKESRNSRDIEDLDGRIERLEERRFPLPMIGGIMGIAGVCVSVMSLIKGG